MSLRLKLEQKRVKRKAVKLREALADRLQDQEASTKVFYICKTEKLTLKLTLEHNFDQDNSNHPSHFFQLKPKEEVVSKWSALKSLTLCMEHVDRYGMSSKTYYKPQRCFTEN